MVRIFDREPPPPAIQYYETVSGGQVGGMPLIGVNFCQAGFNIVAEFQIYEPMIVAGFWPIAADGLGNTYCCFSITKGEFPVGFIDPLVDPINPVFIAASSIEQLLLGMDDAGNNDGDWPRGSRAEARDPDRKRLDEIYQAHRPARGS